MSKKRPRGHVVGKVDRRKGCMYFVDGSGNVRETEMKGFRKGGQGRRNDLCKAKRRKR